MARIRFTATVVLPLAVVTGTYVAIREYDPTPEHVQSAWTSHAYGASPADSRMVPPARRDHGGPGPFDDSSSTEQVLPLATASPRPDPGGADVEASTPDEAADPAPGQEDGDRADDEDHTEEAVPDGPAEQTFPPESAEPDESPSRTVTPAPSPTVTEQAPTPGPEPTDPDDDNSSDGVLPLDPPILTQTEKSVVEATNEVRTEAGCAPLRIHPRLTEAARKHSADMRENHFYGHTSSDGLDTAERVRNAGFDGRVAENIARGLFGGKSTVRAWVRDDEAYAALADCEFTVVGVGTEVSLLGTWSTQILGVE